MKIETRKARAEDTAFAIKVHHAAFYEVVIRQFGKWDDKAQDIFFNKSWDYNMFEIIIADNIECGYIAVVNMDDCVFVREIAILPEFQDKGIGSYMIKKAIEESRKQNLPVKLSVLHSNRACDFYKKLGFEETGLSENFINMELK